jgi:glycerol-3-phosphate acyltransferase PlsX
VVVKSHGGADDRGFANAIKVAANLARSHYAEEFKASMSQLSDVLVHAPTEAHPAGSEESPQ